MDPAAIAWFRENPARMRAFHDLANRRGQNLETALIKPPGEARVAVIRYTGSEDPVAVVYANGELVEL